MKKSDTVFDKGAAYGARAALDAVAALGIRASTRLAIQRIAFGERSAEYVQAELLNAGEELRIQRLAQAARAYGVVERSELLLRELQELQKTLENVRKAVIRE